MSTPSVSRVYFSSAQPTTEAKSSLPGHEQLGRLYQRLRATIIPGAPLEKQPQSLIHGLDQLGVKPTKSARDFAIKVLTESQNWTVRASQKCPGWENLAGRGAEKNSGIYFLSHNGKKVAVFKVGDKRAGEEGLLGKMGVYTQLNCMVDTMPCVLQNPPAEVADQENYPLIVPRWSGGDIEYRNPQILSGCIEPYLVDPKTLLTPLQFTKLVLFMGISGTRDVKDDGAIIGEIVDDGDDTFAWGVDPRPYQNIQDLIKTAVAATDLPILAMKGRSLEGQEVSLSQHPLTPEEIDQLARLVSGWDISAICQKLADEPIPPFFDPEVEKIPALDSLKPIRHALSPISPAPKTLNEEVGQASLTYGQQEMLFGFVEPPLEDCETTKPEENAVRIRPPRQPHKGTVHKIEGSQHFANRNQRLAALRGVIHTCYAQGNVKKAAWTPPPVTCIQGPIHRINATQNFPKIEERATILSGKQVESCQLRMERAKAFILTKQANGETFAPCELVSAIDPFFQIYSEAFDTLPKNGPKQACELIGRFPLRELRLRLKLPPEEVEAAAEKMLEALKTRLPWIYGNSTAPLPTAAPRS